VGEGRHDPKKREAMNPDTRIRLHVNDYHGCSLLAVTLLGSLVDQVSWEWLQDQALDAFYEIHPKWADPEFDADLAEWFRWQAFVG
jgi:hypothetical protein